MRGHKSLFHFLYANGVIIARLNERDFYAFKSDGFEIGRAHV